MTCAHHCLLTQLCRLLDQVGEHGIHLRRALLPTDQLGEVEFATNMITISTDASPPESRVALVHELVHLMRGPAYVDEVAHEEQTVREITARLLVPRNYLPAILEASDPHQVAAELAIDLPTATLGIQLAVADDAVLDEGAA
jgi:hypothetical protein